MSRPLTTREIANNQRVARKTVVGWIDRGVLIQGRRVRLRACRAGRNYRITEDGLREFLAACQGESEPVQKVSPYRASREALAAQERARQSLRQKD